MTSGRPLRLYLVVLLQAISGVTKTLRLVSYMSRLSSRGILNPNKVKLRGGFANIVYRSQKCSY